MYASKNSENAIRFGTSDGTQQKKFQADGDCVFDDTPYMAGGYAYVNYDADSWTLYVTEYSNNATGYLNSVPYVTSGQGNPDFGFIDHLSSVSVGPLGSLLSMSEYCTCIPEPPVAPTSFTV